MKMVMIKNRYLPLGKSVAVPDEEAFQVGDAVVFADENGLHLGEVERLGGKFDPTSDVVFERRATAADLDKARSNDNKMRRARRYCSSLLLKHNLKLKVVDAYANLDFSKAIFYFTANGRIDFRDLVKDLAAELHTRIEMRQINEREEVTMCGGIGPCGQPCCCKRFLGKTGQVAIKMAKNQGIALNPNKINGYCGKLMCCLAYENDVYTDAMRAMPKVGTRVTLPTGETGVVHFNKLLERVVTVELIGDNAVMIDYPLEELQACNESFETIACGCDGGCGCACKNAGENIENVGESAELSHVIDNALDKKAKLNINVNVGEKTVCENAELNIVENADESVRASTYERGNQKMRASTYDKENNVCRSGCDVCAKYKNDVNNGKNAPNRGDNRKNLQDSGKNWKDNVKNLQKTEKKHNNNRKNDNSRKMSGAKMGFQKNERLNGGSKSGGGNEQR